MKHVLRAALVLMILSSCRTLPPSIFLDNSIHPDRWEDVPRYHADPTNIHTTSTRKLSYGDVLYLTRASYNTTDMLAAYQIPMNSDFRVILRYVNPKTGHLTDNESMFLNFVIFSHWRGATSFNFGDNSTGSALNNIINYYQNHKIGFWNALVDNLYYYYSYSPNSDVGYIVLADFNRMMAGFAGAPVQLRIENSNRIDGLTEVISRPMILPDEISFLKNRLTVPNANLRDGLHYTPVAQRSFIFHLSSIELNGARVTNDEMENKVWSVVEWKESRIAYLHKRRLTSAPANKAIKIKVHRAVFKDKKKHVIRLDSDFNKYIVWLNVTPANSIPITNSNKGSFLMGRSCGRDETVFPVQLIQLNMLTKRCLRKYFVTR